jgi:hypothetical protein
MADETSSTEEKAEKDSPTETATVKKKVAKKKSAKKKVAKKKAATKKKVTAKKKAATPAVSTETASGATASSAPTTAKAEVKSATPTAVTEVSAVASKPSASAESKPVPSTVTVQTEPKKDTTLEDSSMTTDSKSTSGFWLKVIFWLVIIILGFMYIRSLAINPQSEDTSAAVEQEAVEAVETSTTAQPSTTNEATGEDDDSYTVSATDDESNASVETVQQGGLESGYSVSAPEQGMIIVESAPADAGEPTEETGQAADTVASAEESVAASDADAAVSDSKAISSTAGEMQSIRDMHAESVSKILKEFDDLRNATRAEIEAMRNRIQAERELREAMAPAPAWSRQGYSPYGGYPPAQQQGYSPYYGR